MTDIDPEVQAHFDELLATLPDWQQDIIHRLLASPGERFVLIRPPEHRPPPNWPERNPFITEL